MAAVPFGCRMLTVEEVLRDGGQGMWEISAPSSQLRCEPETALTVKSINK